MRDVNAGKLAPTWEGPHRVTAIASTGAYYLEDLDKRLDLIESLPLQAQGRTIWKI